MKNMAELSKDFQELAIGDGALTVRKLAEEIKSGSIKDIVVMCGAGISVSCGIPDFRSPKTGLYANLKKYNLPYAEAVFDLEYFKKTEGEAFYELAKDMWPDNYRPSPTHAFIRMLHDKRLLKRCYTQNIDTLEREAGIPPEFIIEAHGSFGSSSCITCKKPVDSDRVRDDIKSGKVPIRCLDESCGGLVKPDIVFFQEGLPDAFFDNMNKDLKEADLLIIMGTSLQVSPFNQLINYVTKTTPRLLMNMEVVGVLDVKAALVGLRLGKKNNTRDYMIQGACDDGVRALCDLLGANWRNDLENLIRTLKSKTKPNKKAIKASNAFPKMKTGYMDYDWTGEKQ